MVIFKSANAFGYHKPGASQGHGRGYLKINDIVYREFVENGMQPIEAIHDGNIIILFGRS